MVEKRVEAMSQVESNRKWLSGHVLVAHEVLGRGHGIKSQKEEKEEQVIAYWLYPKIKIKTPPTPKLLYPSGSPTTLSSHYHSLDPNNFENWGDFATA